MSTEWSAYALKCNSCGNRGRVTTWSDDWCRWGIGEMTGFDGRVYVTGPRPDFLRCEKCGEHGPRISRDSG